MTLALDDPLVAHASAPGEAYPAPGARGLGVAADLTSPVPPKLGSSQVEDATRLRARPVGDLQLARSAPWLIKGVVPNTGLNLIYGASGAGKSFAALDLAAHIALGLPWNDRRTRQAGVAYVALEGAGEAENRVLALCAQHPALKTAPFLFLDGALALGDEADAEAMVALLARETAAWPVRLRLVIVDTLARASEGLVENAAEDMSHLANVVERAAEALEASAVLVHHAPWDAKRPRGSSALYAAANVILEVDAEKAGGEVRRTLSVKKNRFGEEGAAWEFALEPVTLGEDDDGDPIAPCVIAWQGTAHGAAPRLSDKQAIAKRALIKAVGDAGSPGIGHAGHRVRLVARATWRAYAIREGVTDATDPKNQADACRRVEDKLIRLGVVGHRDDQVWLTDDRSDPATARDHSATVAPQTDGVDATDATAPLGRSHRSHAVEPGR